MFRYQIFSQRGCSSTKYSVSQNVPVQKIQSARMFSKDIQHKLFQSARMFQYRKFSQQGYSSTNYFSQQGCSSTKHAVSKGVPVPTIQSARTCQYKTFGQEGCSGTNYFSQKGYSSTNCFSQQGYSRSQKSAASSVTFEVCPMEMVPSRVVMVREHNRKATT